MKIKNLYRRSKKLIFNETSLVIPRRDIIQYYKLNEDERKQLKTEVFLDEDDLLGIFYNGLKKPNGSFHEFYFELANTILNSGHPELAQRYFYKYFLINEGNTDFIFYLTSLLFEPQTTNQQIFNAVLESKKNFNKLMQNIEPFKNERNPNKKLKLGLVCEFFDSSVMRNGILPQLEKHNRKEFEVYCYSDGPIPKDMMHVADYWRQTQDMTEDQLYQLIRKDEIDILRDLSGPVTTCRINTFAKKAAPIQIHGANLTCTSGMKAFDYILSSEYLIPKEEQQYYVEKIYYDPTFNTASLPNYNNNDKFPIVQKTPYSQNNFVTFVYFGSAHKVNKFTVQLWCKILNKIPNAKLIFKAGMLQYPSIRNSFKRMFSTSGINLKKIEFQGYSPYHEMLLEYNRGDIMLDAFPHTGGSTSTEALWQGLPCITLKGHRWSARSGASRLEMAGLSELVAKTPEEYVNIAVALANNPKQLSEYRHNMRSKLKQSTLMDHHKFVNTLENAYRNMWKTWCT